MDPIAFDKTEQWAEQAAEMGVLEEAEDVRGALMMFPFKLDSGTTMLRLGVVVDLILVGPLRRKFDRKLQAGGYERLEVLDPEKMVGGTAWV